MGTPRLGTPVRAANPTVATEPNRNIPPKQAPPPTSPPPAPVIPTSLLQPNEQRLLFVSLFGLLEVSHLSSISQNKFHDVFTDSVTGLQGMGHSRAILHYTGRNMVKYSTAHLPTLCDDMDSLRTCHCSLSRLPTYTAIVSFTLNTQQSADRGGSRSVERSLLGG